MTLGRSSTLRPTSSFGPSRAWRTLLVISSLTSSTSVSTRSGGRLAVPASTTTRAAPAAEGIGGNDCSIRALGLAFTLVPGKVDGAAQRGRFDEGELLFDSGDPEDPLHVGGSPDQGQVDSGPGCPFVG